VLEEVVTKTREDNKSNIKDDIVYKVDSDDEIV
jgi:hypothetical protein